MKRFHVHLHVDDAVELAALKARAQAADMVLLDEGQTSCCYVRSEKHWVTDPQGIAWEHFQTLGSIPVFNEAPAAAGERSACCAPAAGTHTPEAAACCTPTPRGKPVGVSVTPSSSCC
jgi:hypothetical protein